jgi:hypothetical protein
MAVKWGPSVIFCVSSGTTESYWFQQCYLGGPAEELAQQALLDVLHLPDAGRQRCRQLLVDFGVARQLLAHSAGKEARSGALRGRGFRGHGSQRRMSSTLTG